MKQFTLPMALVDILPVILFSIAAVLLMRDLYNKMSKGAFALFAAGVIDVSCAGGLKALYKLLYAAGICDFTPLSEMMFPVQSLGFLLAGLALLAMLTHRQRTALYAAAPPVFKGTFIFVSMMVLGLGMLDAALCVLAARLKKPVLMPLFILSFLCCLSMGYLSAKNFAQASMNWIAEGINVLGQGCFLVGAWLLHKNDLAALRLEQGGRKQ